MISTNITIYFLKHGIFQYHNKGNYQYKQKTQFIWKLEPVQRTEQAAVVTLREGGYEGSGAIASKDSRCCYRVFTKYCVFSEDFKIFRTLAFLCFSLVSVCVHTPGRQNTSAAAELAEFRKITKLKKTQYLMNTLQISRNPTQEYRMTKN